MPNDIQRTTNILGAGSLAYFFLRKLLAVLVRMRATGSLNTIGVAEFNRAVLARGLPFGPANVVDVSPSVAEVDLAIGLAGSDAFAEDNRASWERLAYHMVDKVLQATEQNHLAGSQTLWGQGMRTGHRKPAEEMLERLKRRIPSQFITVKSTLPADADQRPNAVTGHKLFHDLHDRGVVAVTILADNASPFALKRKLAVQDQYETLALAAMLAALPQFGMTKSMAELSRSLGAQGYFAGWAFCSNSLQPVREGFARSLGRRFAGQPTNALYGEVHLGHTIHEAKLSTTSALSDPNALAIDEDIDFDKPLFLLYTLPMPTSERKAWEAFSSEIRRWLGTTYPNAVPIFTSGYGTADERYNGRYWLQVSCLFPLPPVPRPMRAYVEPCVFAGATPLLAASDGDLSLAVPSNGAIAVHSAGKEELR